MGCNESGYANLLERHREAIPPSCNPSEPLNETKEVCESITALILYDPSSISLARELYVNAWASMILFH